jgi:DNA-binding XRE family transcriptional regulator
MTITNAHYKLQVMNEEFVKVDLSELKRGLDGENYGHWLDFHADLVDKRIELGLTQQQVADRLGISQPAISVFEDGSTGIKVQSILNYASALGLELNLSVRKADGDLTNSEG